MIEMLSIDLSNYCTKGCSFCYNHSNYDGSTMWKVAEVVSFAKDCVSNGVKAVSLGGGEPFEYKGVFEVIKALYPICYLSVTSNGLPLEKEEVWNDLQSIKPDKMHISIHHPDSEKEVQRVLKMTSRLKEIGIKPGINLLISKGLIEEAKAAYKKALKTLNPDQIILIPQRFHDTPSPKDIAYVADGNPFQSPSCLLKCSRPGNFVSVSWDKKVNSCSFALGKQPLPSLDFSGLLTALNKVKFVSCEG